MVRITSWPVRAALPALGLAAFVSGCRDKHVTALNVVTPVTPVAVTGFVQTNLIADLATAGAVTVDPLLINPWGIAFGASGALWVSNNGTGTATVYNANGTPLGITVTIPPAPGSPPGTKALPTGVVFNPAATGFVIPNFGPAAFMFATENGTIAAWNPNTGTTAQTVVDHSALFAVYKAITIASEGTARRLYATNFHGNAVDEFDSTFTLVRSFTDSTAPAGFAPFGIANIGNQLYVSYAKQLPPSNIVDQPGVGNGFVDVFNPNGTLARRFITGGRLNSPWAIVQGTPGFGPFGGAIIVGNFGDGTIGAYDAATGALIDVVRNTSGNQIVIPGLWGLAFGPTPTTTTLFFASGPASETHGLVGTLTPATSP